MKVFSVIEDRFNRNKTRNALNCDIEDYNCGGYALGTFSWFCPYEGMDYSNDDRVYLLFENGYNEIEVRQELLEENTQFMLANIEGLRLIGTPEEAAADERIIAYRVSLNIGYSDFSITNESGIIVPDYVDVDFHFRMKDPDDKEWTEKMGWGSIEPCPSYSEPIWNEGCLDGGFEYDGPTVLFALKIA